MFFEVMVKVTKIEIIKIVIKIAIFEKNFPNKKKITWLFQVIYNANNIIEDGAKHMRICI